MRRYFLFRRVVIDPENILIYNDAVKKGVNMLNPLNDEVPYAEYY